MELNTKFYIESMAYETFIKRAHKCQRQTRLGADQSIMINFMMIESGQKTYGRVKNIDTMREKIRGYIEKAIDKFLKKKLTQEEKHGLEFLKVRLAQSYSSSQFLSIVNQGIDLTQRFIE